MKPLTEIESILAQPEFAHANHDVWVCNCELCKSRLRIIAAENTIGRELPRFKQLLGVELPPAKSDEQFQWDMAIG